MTAVLIPVIILLIVLVATRFSSDSRDGRDWTPTSDRLPARMACCARAS